MGDRGPEPKFSPEERRLQGNPGSRARDVADDPQTPTVLNPDALDYVPPPPDWLTAGQSDSFAMAVAAWNGLAPLLVDAKTLRESDLYSLARYCRYCAEWVQLTNDIDANGFTVTNETKFGFTTAPNPCVIARARVEAAIAGLEKELGLSPKARQDLHKRLMAAYRDNPLIPKQDANRRGPIGLLNDRSKDE